MVIGCLLTSVKLFRQRMNVKNWYEWTLDKFQVEDEEELRSVPEIIQKCSNGV